MNTDEKKKRLVVLDTNCVVQILGQNSRYSKVWDAFIEKRFVWCISNEILLEYEEIIFQKVSPLMAHTFIQTFLLAKNVVQKDPVFHFLLITQDADDNKFVDCAIATGADYIVSEDTHFRILKDIPFPNVRIIRLNDFAKDLGLDL